MSEHTPGPWLLEGSMNSAFMRIGKRRYPDMPIQAGQEIASVAIGRSPEAGGPDEEEYANALILAAAPELLEALEWALPFAEAGMEGVEHEKGQQRLAAARAAIAKARGEA
jgi:hypothetical protein